MIKTLGTKGSTTAIAIVVLIAVALLGTSSWIIWNKHQNSKPATNTSQSGTSTTPGATTKPKTTDPSEGGKYLVIGEWGVRFALPDALKNDAYYEYTTDTALEKMILRSKKLDEITKGCGNAPFYLYGGITRSKTRFTASSYPDQYAQATPAHKAIGDYWYDTFSTGNEASQTYTCTNREQVSRNKDSFKESIGGAQAIFDSFDTLEVTPRN